MRNTRTFIPAELNVSEQPDLDDLPQQTQDQVLPALLQVLSSNVHHMAANGWCRVQGQVQVLLLDQAVRYPMHRDSVRLLIVHSGR